MYEWILIIVFTIYSPSRSSMASTSQHIVFPTQQSCIEAGNNSLGLANNVKYNCVSRPIKK